MARQARKKSNTGIYHIMLRGIDRQLIFEDEDDKERFWQTLKDYKKKSGYEVYGFIEIFPWNVDNISQVISI